MITIVIVDDHKVVRQGIRSLLESENDFRVVGEAANGLDGLRLVDSEHPNVLISDLSMEGMNGMELCENIRNSAPATECIILSMHADESYAIKAIRVGAKGYVLKENDFDDVINAVRAVTAKRIFLSASLVGRVAKYCSGTNTFDEGICRNILSLQLNQANQNVTGADKTNPSQPDTTKVTVDSENFNDSPHQATLEEQVQVLQELALMDELTRVGNRRYANISLATKIDELRRYGWPFGVILFDIDDFKGINDVYGHKAGDEVLQAIAKTISSSVRSRNSFFFRWGGDEFLIIASNVNRTQLFDLSERIRISVSNTSFQIIKEIIRVTISLGMAMANPDDKMEKLLCRVDENLYISKKEGKNRSTIQH
jgi:diguanylate cyclase (GGDEF)-like protein